LLVAFWGFRSLGVAASAVGLTLLATPALNLRKRGKEAAKNAFPEEEQKGNDRIFGIANAVTWGSVFLVFQIVPRLGLAELIFPAVVLIVGLDFFATPPLFRHRANLVTGAVMVVWAIVRPLLFHGDFIGVVGGGGRDGERVAGCAESSDAGPLACLNEILSAGHEDPAGAWGERGSVRCGGEE
jgi:hypothetical protein